MSLCCLFIYHNIKNIKKFIQYKFYVAILLHFLVFYLLSYLLCSIYAPCSRITHFK